MSKTRDLDAAKDRLVDTLSVARDATKSAVVDEIAPAVVAAVGAAREASGPMYAEAASRASDAVSALRGSDVAGRASDAAKSVLASQPVNRAMRRDAKSSRKRWTLPLVALLGGAAAAMLAKGKKSSAVSNAYPAPVTTPPPAPSEAPIQAASVDVPIEEPTGGKPATGKPKT